MEIIKDFESEKGVVVLLSISEDEATLSELERLVDTVGGRVVAIMTQNREKPDVSTYIGSGKAKELGEFIENNGEVNLVIADGELSPSQIKNLEDIVGVRVIDRTMLILDIFALHANSAAGKLQVEIACLRYTAPRLMGKGKELSRLGGGIGTRGPGESKLETDRRHIKRRIEALEEKLTELERTRALQKESRSKKRIPTIAIVGYTNAGKSTLLNALTGAGVLAEDKLFATLDPVTRIMKLPEGNEVLLTDTVGFIDRLPHHLVKAFRSTLEELKFADIVMILTDASESVEEQMRKNSVTDSLVEEFGGNGKDVVRVYNKIDAAENREFIPKDSFGISAKTGEGVEKLLSELERIVKSKKCVCKFLVPYANMEISNALYKKATVLSSEYTNEGNLIVAELESAVLPQFVKYIQKETEEETI